LGNDKTICKNPCNKHEVVEKDLKHIERRIDDLEKGHEKNMNDLIESFKDLNDRQWACINKKTPSKTFWTIVMIAVIAIGSLFTLYIRQLTDSNKINNQLLERSYEMKTDIQLIQRDIKHQIEILKKNGIGE
jgi:hypothetical protein